MVHIVDAQILDVGHPGGFYYFANLTQHVTHFYIKSYWEYPIVSRISKATEAAEYN